jgi:hypothetical protein
MVEAAVREACAAVEDTAEFSVQLHPDDLALLQRLNSPLLLPQGGREALRIESSSLVTRGGCMVKTRFGLIDGRRETKADMLRQALAPGAELAPTEAPPQLRTEAPASGTAGLREQPDAVLEADAPVQGKARSEGVLAPGESQEERVLAP